MQRQAKAQGSIEMVLLAGIILILVALILGNYFSISGSTNALIAAKNAALGQQSATSTPFHIERIDYSEPIPGEITFTVSIPELSDMSIFNNDWCIATKAKISSATALSFKINSAIVTVDC